MTKKFKKYIINIYKINKNIAIEICYSIGIVEQYCKLLQHVYLIIITKFSAINPDLIFKMFFKIINDLVKPNRLISTLLVFSAYSKRIK